MERRTMDGNKKESMVYTRKNKAKARNEKEELMQEENLNESMIKVKKHMIICNRKKSAMRQNMEDGEKKKK